MKAYHHNIKKRKISPRLVLGSAFIALFLIIFLFTGFPPAFATKILLDVSNPFLSFKTKTVSFISGSLAGFKAKSALEKENGFLKEKLAQLETKESLSDSVFDENRNLKGVLLRDDKRQFILASIISRPGFGSYNYLTIDAGTKDGVKEGTVATAYGDVLMGYVSEAGYMTSQVKLISFPDKETNVYIQNSVSAIAVGLGGENAEIILPHDVDVKIGSSITTLDTHHLLLGFAEKIIKEPTDPFQKIIFRIPVNIQELRYLYLIK